MVSTGKFPAILRQNARQSVRMICAFSLSYKKFALWKLCDPACRNLSSNSFFWCVRVQQGWRLARPTIRKGESLTSAGHIGFDSLILKHRAQHTNPFFWTLFRHDIVKMLAHTPVYSALFPRPDEKSNQKNGKPKAIIKREVFKAEGCRHTDVWQARQHRKIPFLVGFGGFGYCVLCLCQCPLLRNLFFKLIFRYNIFQIVSQIVITHSIKR